MKKKNSVYVSNGDYFSLISKKKKKNVFTHGTFVEAGLTRDIHNKRLNNDIDEILGLKENNIKRRILNKIKKY